MLPPLRYLLPALYFFTRLAAAQTYEPGLLVRSNGDTLRGEIENGFWVEPPTFIRYRPAASSESQLFKPDQLRAVSFTNGRYFHYQRVALDHAAQTQLADLPRSSSSDIRVESLLVEVLLDGPVSMLRMVLPSSTHYLLQRPGSPVLELSERKYLRQNAQGAWEVMEGNNYLNQLALYFADCPAAAQAGQSAAFTAAGLAAVAQAYATSCSPARQPARSWVALARPRRRGAFQGGLLAGVRYNHIESPASQLVGTCTDCLVHPFGGLYAELLQPSRTTAFYGELSLSNFRNRGVSSLDYAAGTYTTFDYQALLGTARLGVRYFIPLRHDQQLLFGLGLEYNRVFGLSLPAASTQYYSSSNPSEPGNSYASTTLFPNVTAGWRRNRLTLALDFQMYSSLGGDQGLSHIFFDSNFASRFGVSYRLGRNPDTKLPQKAPKP
ncbi:MAG: hypothetical protein ACRYFX_21600 [Janthinobacterium lividum]